MSIYWKARTLISGDYRELERNYIAYHNDKIIKKYKGKKEIYCSIRLFSDEAGLLCQFCKAVGGISYSIQNGYIPVIDMQTKENIFFDKKRRKKENVWECFFEQPAGIHFNDIKSKENVIVFENPGGFDPLFNLLRCPEMTNYWRVLVSKFIRYPEPVKQLIEQTEKLFDKEKTLGVLARGTDYLNPNIGHAAQPDVETVIKNCEEMMARYELDTIFVATEDSNILKRLIEHFGNKVLYMEQKRYAGRQDVKLAHHKDYQDDAIEMNRAYLAAMYCLSRCKYFFGGYTTGTTALYIMGDEFTDFNVLYYGSSGLSTPDALNIDKLNEFDYLTNNK